MLSEEDMVEYDAIKEAQDKKLEDLKKMTAISQNTSAKSNSDV